jgi:hypothetical protein
MYGKTDNYSLKTVDWNFLVVQEKVFQGKPDKTKRRLQHSYRSTNLYENYKETEYKRPDVAVTGVENVCPHWRACSWNQAQTRSK